MIVMADDPRLQPGKKRRRPPAIVERPLCPLHGDTMYSGSSPEGIAYYYCEASECDHSRKIEKRYFDVKRNHRD